MSLYLTELSHQHTERWQRVSIPYRNQAFSRWNADSVSLYLTEPNHQRMECWQRVSTPYRTKPSINGILTCPYTLQNQTIKTQNVGSVSLYLSETKPSTHRMLAACLYTLQKPNHQHRMLAACLCTLQNQAIKLQNADSVTVDLAD